MDSLSELKNPVKIRYNNGRPNVLSRVSVAFANKFMSINKKREEMDLNELSAPKITELIIRHKVWKGIEEDIINFRLDGGDEE